MEESLFLTLESLHLVGVVLFLGTVIVSAWWKLSADRTRDAKVIAFAQAQVAGADLRLTLIGIVLIALGGPVNAILQGLPFTLFWVALAMILFSLSVLIWLVLMIPLQRRLCKMTAEFSNASMVPEEYWGLERRWMLFGTLSMVLALSVIPVMVFKPD